MAEITAALVKELRERSGVGMMDCKKALVENNGDIDAAIDPTARAMVERALACSAGSRSAWGSAA